ncbi:1-deoxy-D-xylulose-5-phosphate synthase [Candidatus Kinetoplastibacterium sorsogonicusi]|uniref:1-deoxy-D-xylulose-5-phosphate synthase n=1 Tax=Candidatus Kinetoplastidibacterium kentomonadis TaxID=1576550 RepID=A0A3S7J9X5_9PROT|nr:1-deoxy-D-xylulose-5-phosphate synthase [Candidatus Kinetoplastibacterium sorsogonicusi]AWD32477.1 1-deoxy-D-xylulose-5-phosphate synthase [Candidatus Kinetoplastibacterium sorsogonicusi]
MHTPTLDKVSSPEILKYFCLNELKELANDLRKEIIDIVSKNGGHLSSNLGIVELTIAIYKIFNFPEDKVIWDVGHQSYAHKILTGRRHIMQTLRKKDGAAGFPQRIESKFDIFGTGHSSTSISAALGLAVAARNKNINRKNIAIIGDGAMSAGMAFEAINNAGVTKDINLLVILNDNSMSISPPVGALENYLAYLTSKNLFNTAAKYIGKTILDRIPKDILFNLKKLRKKAKKVILPSNIFENFGFQYIGPVDGHNLEELIINLEKINSKKGLFFLHVITKKGMGYKPAEINPVLYHGPSKFDPIIGIQKQISKSYTFTQIFSKWLLNNASNDQRLVCITPAMKEGSGLVEFAKNFPNRYFDVGIAEQHAITFAAGMACDGMKPIVTIYSTFLQRGYDQLIHDVAIQNLDVTFVIDRAGLVGFDGATHSGNYDIAFLRCIPNIIISTPSNKKDLLNLLSICYKYNGPSAIRYPKDICLDINFVEISNNINIIGKSNIINSGKNIAILGFGPILNNAIYASEELKATLVDMRFVKPLDENLIIDIANTHKAIVTIEDSAIHGGAGSAISEFLNQSGINIPIFHIGLPDKFIDHGERSLLMKDLFLDEIGILKTIKKKFSHYII